MTSTDDIPDILRLIFFNGQRLTDRDLTESQRAQRELRWLHNRSLHRWGIAYGLAATAERGETTVTVSPGYGVDCMGREIILSKPHTMQVPATSGGPGGTEAVIYLVAAYRADDDQTIAERRPGVCLPEGTVRLSETPLIEWRQPDQLHEGHELIIAQAWIQNCRLSRPLSLTPRRSARPADRPYIAAGRTTAGSTAWEPWQADEQPLGVQTQVDTSTARFRTTPHYMAHIIGDRHFTDDSGQFQVLTAAVSAVSNPTPTGFTLLMRIDSDLQNLPTIVSETLQWTGVWMGIEG